MIFINPHKCCTFVTEKSCLTSNANLCIIQKLKLLPSHYLYWGETLVNRSFLAIRHILAEFLGKILPNGVEIFSKTEGSTFYFQSLLPYLCTCTITVDAKRKDHVEERKSERQMKIETSRKFLDCAIKNGTVSCGYKSQPLSARQTKKSPWQYRLEVFQGIPPRIFLAVP